MRDGETGSGMRWGVRPRRGWLLPLLLGLATAAGAETGEDAPWRLGVHPFVATTEVMERFRPLVDHLSAETGEAFELHVANSYGAHVRAVGDGDVDLAYIGPAGFVRLWETHGEHPVLAREVLGSGASFRGVLVVREDHAIETLAQVAGHSVAFVDVDSTMGYRMPMALLERAGVAADDLGQKQFFGNHFDTASAVLLGDADVAAMREEMFERFEGRGLRALAYTPAVPRHPFVARRGLDAERREQWSAILIGLSGHADGPAVFAALGGNVAEFVPGTAEEYRGLREMLEVTR